MKLIHKTTTLLGIAWAVGGGVAFGSPTVYAQSPPPLLAQANVKVYVVPSVRLGQQNYHRSKFYNRDRFNPRYRDYRGISYYYPCNCYKRNATRLIQRDYWGNPVFSRQQDFWAPAGFNRRDFYYHGW